MSNVSKVDQNRLEHAIVAANFLVKGFINTGRYDIEERWGPEGLLYLAESSYALITAYKATNERNYLVAVKSILEALKTAQKPTGGWALELGPSGIRFTITDEIRSITSLIEDLPPTVGALKVIADYSAVSGDRTYVDMGKKAFDFLMEHWDSDYGSFREKENNELMALRSNPRSYHLFSLLGIQAWQQEEDSASRLLPTIIEFVKKTFEAYDAETMPLVYGLHAAVLSQVTGKDYPRKTIMPKIKADLVEYNPFKIEAYPGAYGHRDGLRGIVKDEAHMRSSAGLAIAMKFYDLNAGDAEFTNTQTYLDISNWIQGMKGRDFFYEFEYLPENKKMGKGSPGQYLPIWWILGEI